MRRLFAVKGRAPDKPLPLFVASAADLPRVAVDVPRAARRLAERFWPGPLTLILKAKPGLPFGIVGTQGTIAARISSHPIAHRLVNILGRPITATSANLAGKEEPTRAEQVLKSFAGQLDLILDAGPTPGGKASTLVDLTGKSPRILRPGAISGEEMGLGET